jgi:hypothetical protein
MKKIGRLIFLGVIVWVIPFVLSFGFYDSKGNLATSYDLFKSSMIVISSIVGCFLLYRYFRAVTTDFVREGIVAGIIWLAINLLLDVLILVPFAKMEIKDYVVSIGLRYLQIPVISTMAGFLLHRKTQVV